MPTLGIIGSGNIGAAVARLAIAADIPVVIANSRGPESLADLVVELGPLATAGTVDQAAEAGDIVVASIPLAAYPTIPSAPMQGKTMLDTSNYYPFRDGQIADLDEDKLTTSEFVQRQFGEVAVVKAFNNIMAHLIPQLPRQSGASDRTALPIAGDHGGAKAEAAHLIDRLGFDTFDAGPLAESWRFEPASSAYINLYLADPADLALIGPETTREQMMEVKGSPVSASTLQSVLRSGERVRTADRPF